MLSISTNTSLFTLQTKPSNPIVVETQDKDYFLQRFPPLRNYDALYSSRSNLLLPIAKNIIREKWPQAILIEQLTDVELTKSSKDLAIAGLIFKDSKQRPNVIKIFQKERGVHNIYRHTSSCIDKDDTIFVEDTHARVKLAGNINSAEFATGVPLALRVHVNAKGDFEVVEIANLGIPPQLHSLKENSRMQLFYLVFF